MGAISGAEAQVAEQAAKVAKEKYGLTVKIVEFSDFATPNVALNDGSIDVNAFQHKPYLDQQIKDRGFKLAVVGNTVITSYSIHYTKLYEDRHAVHRSRWSVPPR